MSDLDTVWAGLAAGTAEVPSNPHVRKLVLVRARNAADHPDESERVAALHVLRRVGGTESMGVATAFSGDSSKEIRQRLLAMARDAGPEGSPVLKKLAVDADAEIVVQALDRLHDLQDRGATTQARSLMTRPEAPVRREAIRYLGTFGGASLAPAVRGALKDTDASVVAIAEWALERLEGRTPASTPPTPASPTPASPAANETAASARSEAPAPPPVAPEVPPANPESATEQGRSTHVEPVASQEVTAKRVEVPVRVLDIFAAIATDAERRPHLIEALKRAEERELSEAFRTRKPGTQAAHNAGAALAAAGLANPRWLAPVRKLSGDPNPEVRAAVATALGALCTPAVLTSLEELVQDADRTVHFAALDALVAGAQRIGAVPAARKLIQSLRASEDESVQAARAAALAALGS